MKFRIVSPDAAGAVDCVLRSQMLDFLPKSNAPDAIPFVPISYYPNYTFSYELHKLEGRPWILADMTENAWDWDMRKNNVLGTGITRDYGHIASDEWAKLDDWVRDHPPVIQFKRELKLSDKSPTLMPCEHLCYLPIPTIQTKAEFDARPIEVMHLWGWSHPSRAILHAEIFRAMTDKNIGVVSEMSHLDGCLKNPSPRTWAAIYAPWYARKPMGEVMSFQQKAKISVSLWGAGKKCFRSAEAPVGAIMALPFDELAWSFDWEHQVNCVRLCAGREFEDLDKNTTRDDLYEIYVRGMETIRKYESQRYVDSYIVPTIEAVA